MRWTNPIKRSLAAAALAASPFGTPLLAQEVTSELDPSELIETGDTMAQSNVGFGNGSFFVAPVPRATPTLGNSVYLLGGYIFQADPGSRTSFLGVGTMFNENGSDLNAVGGRLSLFDRKLQVRFGIGEGELFYDTFVGNFAVPVKQEVTGYLLSLGYGVRDDLTIGVIGRYTDSVISPDAGALPPSFPIQDVELEVGRAGVFAEYETTDNDVFPRTGWRVNLSADWGSASGSEDFDRTRPIRLLPSLQGERRPRHATCPVWLVRKHTLFRGMLNWAL